MVKKWIDTNKIAEVADMPEDLYRYYDLMKEVPNFDKTDEAKRDKDKLKYRNKNINSKMK